MITDLDMPRMDGVELTTHVMEELSGCRVLVLTGRGDDVSLQGAITAGVVGYLLKSGVGPPLIGAIDSVHRGEPVLDPQLAARVLQGDEALRRCGSGLRAQTEAELRLVNFARHAIEATKRNEDRERRAIPRSTFGTPDVALCETSKDFVTRID